jgi:hypothetical protein
MKRPAGNTASIDEEERASPARERITVRPNRLKDYAVLVIFLFGAIFAALMLLLGLAFPAIVMAGLCLLLIERRTR